MEIKSYIDSLKNKRNKYSHLEFYMYGITSKDDFDTFVNDLFDEIKDDVNNQIAFRKESNYFAPVEKEYKDLSDCSERLVNMAMMYKVLRGF